MDGRQLLSLLEHLAEKSMGRENAPRDGNQLHVLVLVRAALFPKSATKCVLCCYSNLGLMIVIYFAYKSISREAYERENENPAIE